MKAKKLFIHILAVLISLLLIKTVAQAATIEVLGRRSIIPGTGNQTLPQKINEKGDVVGVFLDLTGVSRGFVRFSDGSFSAPIVDPNDTVGFTEARGINN